MTSPPPSPSPAPLVSTRCVLPDEAATHALGVALGRLVAEILAAPTTDDTGFTIHLSGDLGAGKTTLVRALLKHLGVTDRIKSPSYTLVEPYVVEMPKGIATRQRLNLYCYHFDFYRFENPHEWEDAGFRDYFSDASLRLVEWPERASSDACSLLPAPDLHVTLETRGEGRVATVAAESERGAAWLSRIELALASPPSSAAVDASSRPD
ncbi:MAG: tRNA (adenosine(37)-N6)-threonylcarbamoyltransferase complex ATPase subunit type 1 TsaE [Burkholderiaceae bacterium]